MVAVSDAIIETLGRYKHEISDRFSVESLAVFGSVSRGSAGPESDVDILVRYRATPTLFQFLDLKQFIEGIVGRRVDLVTEPALKKQLREKILKEAILVA